MNENTKSQLREELRAHGLPVQWAEWGGTPVACSVSLQTNTGEEFLVSPEDAGRVRERRWYRRRAKDGRVYVTSRGASGKTVHLHRFIMAAPDGVEVDHINGNPLDNRRENLRLCNRKQNLANRPGLASVRMHHGKWVARTARDGSERRIGSYDSKEEAVLAYMMNLREERGEFCPPFPPGDPPVGWREKRRSSGLACRKCGAPFDLLDSGRPRVYCSDRCKERARTRR